MTARELATQLIRDDMSRIDEGVPIERDGHRAVIGWIIAAWQAGDTETSQAIYTVGEGPLIKAWDELIDDLCPIKQAGE